jgi:hypothetical protein
MNPSGQRAPVGSPDRPYRVHVRVLTVDRTVSYRGGSGHAGPAYLGHVDDGGIRVGGSDHRCNVPEPRVPFADCSHVSARPQGVLSDYGG